VPTPNSTLYSWNQLNGVAALSTDDVWAVGSLNTSPYYSLIEHWDGTLLAVWLQSARRPTRTEGTTAEEPPA
jgi:hypothetical protein